jgi:nitroreductase
VPRVLAGTQPYVREAPVNLVYVSAYAKQGDKEPIESKILLSGAHACFIAENIYLYCASEGLAAVVRAMIDVPALSKAMKLHALWEAMTDNQLVSQSASEPRATHKRYGNRDRRSSIH